MDTINKVSKKRKSKALTPSQFAKLKKFVAKYTSLSEAADEMGINRSTFERIHDKGKGSPDNISIVLQKLAA